MAVNIENIENFRPWVIKTIETSNSITGMKITAIKVYDEFVKYYNTKVNSISLQPESLKIIRLFKNFLNDVLLPKLKEEETAEKINKLYKFLVDEFKKLEDEIKMAINLQKIETSKEITTTSSTPDTFDTVTNYLSTFWNEHKELILIGGAVVLGIILFTRKD